MAEIERNGGSLEKAFKEYEQKWHILWFENIRAWLCDKCPDAKIQLSSVCDPNRFLALTAAVVDQVAFAYKIAAFTYEHV